MTTPHARSRVSLAAALTATLALGACAGGPARHAGREPARLPAPPIAVRFENEARDYVHVYLVGAKREWLLGRVAPGALAMLRIPDAALAGDLWSMQLAVLVGERATLRAADDPRAAITLAQPAAAILAHRWTFSKVAATGELVGLPPR